MARTKYFLPLKVIKDLVDPLKISIFVQFQTKFGTVFVNLFRTPSKVKVKALTRLEILERVCTLPPLKIQKIVLTPLTFQNMFCIPPKKKGPPLDILDTFPYFNQKASTNTLRKYYQLCHSRGSVSFKGTVHKKKLLADQGVCKDALASPKPKDQKSSRNSHRCSIFFIRSKQRIETSNLNQSRISIIYKKTTISYWKPSMT